MLRFCLPVCRKLMDISLFLSDKENDSLLVDKTPSNLSFSSIKYVFLSQIFIFDTPSCWILDFQIMEIYPKKGIYQAKLPMSLIFYRHAVYRFKGFDKDDILPSYFQSNFAK